MNEPDTAGFIKVVEEANWLHKIENEMLKTEW